MAGAEAITAVIRAALASGDPRKRTLGARMSRELGEIEHELILARAEADAARDRARREGRRA